MNSPVRTPAIYARVSSERQTKDHTIDSQAEALKARVQADGLTLDAEFTFLDDGYSGTSLVRPALERLRDQVAIGTIDRIYIHSPDRLARKQAYQYLLIEEFSRAGVEVVFLNHKVEDSPEGALLLQIQGTIAEYERAKILERSRRGRLHAARSGAISVLGKAPYGYRYLTKTHGAGQASYQVVLEEARVVRKIFAWVGRDRFSLREVARRLKVEGVRTRGGKTNWDRSTLLGMLSNPAYKGMAAYGKTRCVEPRPRLRPRRGQPDFPRHNSGTRKTTPDEQILIPVPALIDDDVFQSVQEQLAWNRKHHGRPAGSGRYLLQGLLVCGKCGYAYYGKPTGGKRAKTGLRYSYYRCIGTDGSRYGGRAVCHNQMVRTDELDAQVWEDVRSLLMDPSRIEAEYQRRLVRAPREQDRSSRSIGALIKSVKRRMARLVEMYEEGFIEREEFRNRMSSAKERIAALELEAHGG